MNIGLLYTPVSIYQMTRGALVLFVGILSVIFLRRHLWLYQLSITTLCLSPGPYFTHSRWVSLITVMAGVGLVGFSGSLIKDAIKVAPLPSLTGPNATVLHTHVLTEEPEVTKVLVGEF